MKLERPSGTTRGTRGIEVKFVFGLVVTGQAIRYVWALSSHIKVESRSVVIYLYPNRVLFE